VFRRSHFGFARTDSAFSKHVDQPVPYAMTCAYWPVRSCLSAEPVSSVQNPNVKSSRLEHAPRLELYFRPNYYRAALHCQHWAILAPEGMAEGRYTGHEYHAAAAERMEARCNAQTSIRDGDLYWGQATCHYEYALCNTSQFSELTTI